MIVLVCLLFVVAWPQYLSGFNTLVGKTLWLVLIALLSQRNQVLALLAVVAFIRILGLQKKFTPTVQPLTDQPFFGGINSNSVPAWKMQTMTPLVNDEKYTSVV